MCLKTILSVAGSLFAAVLTIAPVAAQDFPQYPVTLAVNYAPGGGTDTYARAVAPYLAKELGVSVAVENWEGAGGRIGMDRVARSKPDGYTLALDANFALAMQELQFETSYKVADLSYVGSVAEAGRIMLTSAGSDLKTFKDVLSRPIKIGVAGRGSNDHVQNILINNVIGANVTYVFYQGTSEALAGLLRGEIDVVQPPFVTGMRFVKDGLARALVVHQAERAAEIPEVPTIGEVGFPDLEKVTVSAWVLVGPPGLPDDVLAKLRDGLAKACQDPALLAWGKDNGFPITCRDGDHAKESILGVQLLTSKYRDLLKGELKKS